MSFKTSYRPQTFKRQCILTVLLHTGVCLFSVVYQRHGHGRTLGRALGLSCWMECIAQEMSCLWRNALMHPGASTTVITWRMLESRATRLQVKMTQTVSDCDTSRLNCVFMKTHLKYFKDQKSFYFYHHFICVYKCID